MKTNKKINNEKTVDDYMDIKSFKLPKGLNTQKKKRAYVKDKIHTVIKLSENDKKNTIKWEWIIGKWFNILKNICKGKKGLFGRVVAKNYPELSDKRREWLMKLAKKIKIIKYPALARLDKNRLVPLIQIAKNNSVENMLYDNEIKVDVNMNSYKAMKVFKMNIDKFINIKAIPKNIKAAYETLEKQIDIIIENPNTIKDNPEVIESSKAMVKKLNNIMALKSKYLLK